MSDQTIHSPEDVPKDNVVMVGPRGGLKYKDGFKNIKGKPKGGGPCMVCKGAGYDIAFFREGGRYRVRYKGNLAEAKLEEIRNYARRETE